MGAFSLFKSKASIDIETNATQYLAGDYIEGVVTITINKPFKCYRITLCALGEETITNSVRNSRRNSVGSSVKHYSNDIFNDESVLDNFYGSNIRPSLDKALSYPFTIKLPTTLPSTVAVKSTNENSAKVDYNFIVTIDVNSTFSRDVRFRKKFYVLGFPNLTANYSTEVKNRKNLRFLGIFSKGKCSLHAVIVPRTDRNDSSATYYKNETIRLQVKIDNSESSTPPITELKLMFQQRIAVQGDRGIHAIATFNVQSFNIHEDIRAYSSQQPFIKQYDIRLSNNQRRSSSSMYPSTIGHKFEISHAIRIKCKPSILFPSIELEVPFQLLTSSKVPWTGPTRNNEHYLCRNNTHSDIIPVATAVVRNDQVSSMKCAYPTSAPIIRSAPAAPHMKNFHKVA